MPHFLRAPLTIAIFYIPLVAFFVAVFRARKSYERAAREPFTDQPLRLPGESARQKAEVLVDGVEEKMLGILVGCPIPGMAYAFNGGPMALGVILLLGASAAAILVGLHVRKQLKEAWRYRLGARGEQVVARELDRLMARGYEVYHDVCFEGCKWNIDHVVIGPRGVFAIETKAWRKPPKGKDAKPEVILNGAQLTWPGKQDKFDPIPQAERNSQSLEREIAQRAGERTEVVPVVALPGWFVRIKKFGKVAVYSAKDMGETMIQRGRAQLSPDQIIRIGFVVRQACVVKPN